MKKIILASFIFFISCSSYNSKRDAATNANDCAKQCQDLGRQDSFNQTNGVCECDEF